ncbi:MAG: protein translocase subunit SecF [Halothiobacillaceae bacterium]|jgi:preprotein translocase subunit SecF|nr:protein translocase subunit SecF [Halothiobacillaceae bacterium]
MRFIPNDTRFDFFGKRRISYAVTVLFLAIAIGSLAIKGLKFGLDFTGGTLIEVSYPQSVELEPVRAALGERELGDALVQHFGSGRDVLVRLPPREGENQASLSNRVLEALKAVDPKVEMKRVEFVGPAVGKELVEAGGLAVIFVLLGILVYVGMRFEFKLAFGAIQALAHDLVIALGLVSLLGIEFDLTVLAALLALAGYSINDTIVIFDRMRENFLKMRKASPIEIMNKATNETLSRTIMTSGTTLITVASLLVFGGSVLHGFSLVLFIGIVMGTYSSVFVASAIALDMGLKRADLLKSDEENKDKTAEADATP